MDNGHELFTARLAVLCLSLGGAASLLVILASYCNAVKVPYRISSIGPKMATAHLPN